MVSFGPAGHGEQGHPPFAEGTFGLKYDPRS
jgi:hypothetical protein